MAQITAAARATITVTKRGTDEATGRQWIGSEEYPKVANDYRLWLPKQDPLDAFEPFIALSKGYVELLRKGQMVPVRRDLLAKIVGEPMAFDVMMWLGSVTYWLYRSGRRDAFYTWDDLYAAFTHDYARLDNFVTKWKTALTEAMRYYPEGRVEIVRGTRARPGGVRVGCSPLLIEPRRGN